VYPKRVKIDEVAYFFDYEFEDTLPDDTYADVAAGLSAWRDAWCQSQRPTLTFRATSDSLSIEDLRNPSAPLTYTFSGFHATLYSCCSDRPMTLASVQNALSSQASPAQVATTIEDLCAQGLMVLDEGQVVSLALPAEDAS
jgi:hypothetical protein